MLEREVEIVNKLGLHARAAAKLVGCASAYASDVTVSFKSQSVDAKSIMSVMLLAASKGSVISIRCEGRDESAAMDAVTDLIANRFGEAE